MADTPTTITIVATYNDAVAILEALEDFETDGTTEDGFTVTVDPELTEFDGPGGRFYT